MSEVEEEEEKDDKFASFIYLLLILQLTKFSSFRLECSSVESWFLWDKNKEFVGFISIFEVCFSCLDNEAKWLEIESICCFLWLPVHVFSNALWDEMLNRIVCRIHRKHAYEYFDERPVCAPSNWSIVWRIYHIDHMRMVFRLLNEPKIKIFIESRGFSYINSYVTNLYVCENVY